MILYRIHLYQLILYIHICIYHHSSIVYYYKHCYLVWIYTYTFCAILASLVLCLASLVLDIELNNLTLSFLQHQKHTILRVGYCFTCLILKGKKIDHLLLMLTICGHILHSCLFIEIQLNEFTFVKIDKNANPVKNTF